MRQRHRLVVAALVAAAATPAELLAQGPTPPTLVIEAPAPLQGLAAQMRSFDAERLTGVMTLTGMTDPGPPIRVLLLPEDSPTARTAPEWVVGFADSTGDVVVLFPSRIGSFPYRSMERVLYHEVAHVLIARVAKGAPVPRWFNEGLASAAERSWGLEDRSRFAWQLLVGGPLSATRLEAMFGEGPREIARAYTLSDALVRDILERHSPSTPALVLQRMGDGASFDAALYAVTGLTVTQHVRSFWTRHAVWDRWIAFLGHPFTLWSFVTLLALLAIWRHRRRRLQRRRQWEMEERAEQRAWEEHRQRYRVH